MKVWITKYALTQGIIEAETISYNSELDIITIPGKKGWNQHYHGEGREWHKTRDAAVNKANDMKKQKIESLNKQLNNLKENIFF